MQVVCYEIVQVLGYRDFSLNMGIASNNIAKLGAIHQGLILAWNLGFRFIHLEIDSMTVLS